MQSQARLKAITPEIAACVVRDFILPMFENDGKKILKKKHKRQIHSLNQSLANPSATPNEDLNQQPTFAMPKPPIQPNTVYSELKLSD